MHFGADITFFLVIKKRHSYVVACVTLPAIVQGLYNSFYGLFLIGACVFNGLIVYAFDSVKR